MPRPVGGVLHFRRLSSNMHAIKVDKIGFSYATQWMPRDISFCVDEAGFLGIIAPNGSEKTTLFRIIDSVLQPWGSIRIGVFCCKI